MGITSKLSSSKITSKFPFNSSQFNFSLTISLFMASDNEGVKYEENYITNSRGMKLFTCSWIPTNEEPKALIFLCHGYAMECSITMKSTAIRLIKAGFAVYGMDYEGHGKSDGLQGYVTSFDALVDDCSNHFTSICEKKENKGKTRYLMGESMGGAVTILLHRKKPNYWDGGILVAPMCKIADDLRPNPVVISILKKLSGVVPTWKLIPSQDIIDLAFRQPEVREQVRNNPLCYKGRPRLKTGYELFQTTIDIEQNLHAVSFPFLLLHGEADRVTDLSVSKQLYDQASSRNKTFKTYPGMWHGLLYGETPENIDIVFSDIIGWLDENTLSNDRMEMELKQQNDDHSDSKYS